MTEETTMLGGGQGVIEPTTDTRMFSLMEVAQETGIAMPILLRYKREHPERIPSIGSGAQQRFPEEAFAIFAEIREEESQERDLPRRGGFGLLSLPRIRRARHEPREEPSAAREEPSATREEPSAAREEPSATREEPSAAREEPSATREEPSAGRRRPAIAIVGQPAAAVDEPSATAAEPAPPAEPGPRTTGEATLTLKDISGQLGIAYPTVARYAAKFPDRIPHEGDGRQRRFPPEALAVFEQIRKESKPGRPPKSKTAKAATARPTHGQAAQPAAPRPATVAAPMNESRLLRRIERLEREHVELEALVRSLRDELQRPLRATIRPD